MNETYLMDKFLTEILLWTRVFGKVLFLTSYRSIFVRYFLKAGLEWNSMTAITILHSCKIDDVRLAQMILHSFETIEILKWFVICRHWLVKLQALKESIDDDCRWYCECFFPILLTVVDVHSHKHISTGGFTMQNFYA